ncbi:hypothetical protein KP509_02G090700 [Ceratopteris richardii]|uniref:Uncharacterized protein n=1 Tax=Ceratopteris richardii TaxID=49495 RepID=A0A8T2VGD2_CERRI|nr:hypothetical protein KP509_02G090700 [Ceratopteris richardii]
MLMWESALLGLEPGRVAPRNPFSSSSRGADTLAWITGDGYEDSGEESSTRHPGMNVNSLDRGNHSSPERGNSPTRIDTSRGYANTLVNVLCENRKARHEQHPSTQNYCCGGRKTATGVP